MKKKIVLLDANAIIHRAYHALPDFSTRQGIPTGGLFGTASMLIKIIDELKPDCVIACYDLPKPTFRHNAYSDYKGGRKKADSELVEQLISSREIFQAFDIPIYQKEGFEADDLLGTLAEILKQPPIGGKNNEIFIASGDMDTLQIVDEDQVKVYTLKNGNNTIIYNEKEVFKKYGFHSNLIPDFKGLAGDPSDNIIGIKGIGQKTTTGLIIAFGSIENIYKNLKKDEINFSTKVFEAKITPRIIKLLKEGEEEALFSKELAIIKRDVKINFIYSDKNFLENINLSQIGDIFRKYEFRNLLNRLKKVLGATETTGEITMKNINKIDQEKIEKLKLAVYLLNSNITEPTIDDILNFL